MRIPAFYNAKFPQKRNFEKKKRDLDWGCSRTHNKSEESNAVFYQKKRQVYSRGAGVGQSNPSSISLNAPRPAAAVHCAGSTPDAATTRQTPRRSARQDPTAQPLNYCSESSRRSCLHRDGLRFFRTTQPAGRLATLVPPLRPAITPVAFVLRVYAPAHLHKQSLILMIM